MPLSNITVSGPTVHDGTLIKFKRWFNSILTDQMCERGNINKCYICGNWVTEKDSAKLYSLEFYTKDNLAYNEDICDVCESIVADVKKWMQKRIGE